MGLSGQQTEGSRAWNENEKSEAPAAFLQKTHVSRLDDRCSLREQARALRRESNGRATERWGRDGNRERVRTRCAKFGEHFQLHIRFHLDLHADDDVHGDPAVQQYMAARRTLAGDDVVADVGGIQRLGQTKRDFAVELGRSRKFAQQRAVGKYADQLRGAKQKVDDAHSHCVSVNETGVAADADNRASSV